MKVLLLCALAALNINYSNAQSIDDKINAANADLVRILDQKKSAEARIEGLKLERVQRDLEEIGLPAVGAGEQLVKHAAYYLDYVPSYRQARWVAHIITPDVINGIVFRTNDFREDSTVKGGSAAEADYFSKKPRPDGTFDYDGYGFDRGHLAPSADFRWSQRALSESYLYSNMSPQVADFNRGGWGDLEDAVRGYIYRNPTSQLYVVTGPILRPGLPVIERGPHKVAIPEYYFKVVMDKKNNRAIGFIMPNKAITQPLKTFAATIDSVEKATGLDFYNKLPKDMQVSVESRINTADWLPETSTADIEPLAQQSLPKGYFNTDIAKQYTKSNKEITVCGTVVGARLSRAGNVLINLDKQFPNQVFTVFIKKENISNFSYKPEDALKGKIICVTGKVMDQGGTATMYVDNEAGLKIQ